MYKILLFIALSTLIWSACTQTDQPDPIAEVPVFNISLQPNNPDMDSVNLVAGENGIYLFTQTEYFSEVLRMTGSFASVDCPNGDCPGSVQFEFRNDKIGPTARVDSLFGKNRSWTYKSIFLMTHLSLTGLRCNGLQIMERSSVLILRMFPHWILSILR